LNHNARIHDHQNLRLLRVYFGRLEAMSFITEFHDPSETSKEIHVSLRSFYSDMTEYITIHPYQGG